MQSARNGAARILCVTVMLTAVALCVSGSVALQGGQRELTQVISLNFRDAPFQEVMAQLSEKLKAPVVLDGHLVDSKVSVNFEGPASQVLNSLCRSQDLEWRVGTGGAILFVKKFKRDLSPPQANPQEIHALAEAALRVLPKSRPFTGPLEWGADVRQFGRSLSPEQADALRAGRRLAWDELSPAQRTQLVTCLNGRFYGGPSFAWSLIKSVTGDPRSTTLKLEPSNRQALIKVAEGSRELVVSMGFQLKKERQ